MKMSQQHETLNSPQNPTPSQDINVVVNQSENFSDPKNFANSKYNYRLPDREAHKKEAAKLALKKAKKKARALSKKGRVQNQALEFFWRTALDPRLEEEEETEEEPLPDYVDLTSPEGIALLRKAEAKSKSGLMNAFKNFRLKVTPTDDQINSRELRFIEELSKTYDFNLGLKEVFLNLAAYICALTVSDTNMQVAAATAQLFAGLYGFIGKSYTVDTLVKKLLKGDIVSNTENQSFSSDAIKMMQSIRYNMNGLSTIPMYDFIAKIFLLASLLGVTPPSSEREDIISQAYNKWLDGVSVRAKSENFVELLIDTLTFSVEFTANLFEGTASKFFAPSEISKEIGELKAMEEACTVGRLGDLGTTLAAYRARVDSIVENLKTRKRNVNPMLSFALDGFLRDMLILQNKLARLAKDKDLHEPAPVVVYYGGSQIGKSGIMFATARLIGAEFKFPVQPRNLWYPQKGDEYDSGFTGETTVIMDDDIAADMPDKISAKAALNFLRYNNIVPYDTVQADLVKKGTIPFCHSLAVGSTNIEDLNLQHSMAHPEAGWNRITFVEVKLNPEFADKQGRLDDTKVKGKDLNPDAHMFRFYTVKQGQKQKTACPIKEDKWYDSREFFPELIRRLTLKKQAGRQYLQQIHNITNADVCPRCKLFKTETNSWCQCLENQAGEVFGSLTTTNPIMSYLAGPLTYFVDPMPFLYDYASRKILPVVVASSIERIIDVSSIGVLQVVMYTLRIFQRSVVAVLWFAILFTVLAHIIVSTERFMLTRSILVLWIVSTYLFIYRFKKMVTRAVISDLSSDDRVKTICLGLAKASVGVAGLYMTITTLRDMYRSSLLQNQGNIQPTSLEEVEKRNAEPNPWLTAAPSPIPRDTTLVNMTLEQVKNRVTQHTVFVTGMLVNGRGFRTNGILITNNVILIPKHTADNVDVDQPITIKRHVNLVGGVVAGVFLSNPTRCSADLVGFTTSKALAVGDLKPFLAPTIIERRAPCVMLTRTDDGYMSERTLMYNPCDTNNETEKSRGSEHVCSQPTAKGHCGSPIILQASPCYIIGYHAAARNVGTPAERAISFALTRLDVENMLITMTQARENQAYVGPLIMNMAEPLLDQYGEKTDVVTELHVRDCVNYVAPDKVQRPLRVLGSVPNQRFSRYSEVRISPISALLTEQGRPCKWGKVKFNVNRNHAASFQIMLDPIFDVKERLLNKVVDDYLTPIIAKIKELGMNASPLTLQETVNGKAGSRFCKRMNMKTSSGFNLKSPKSLHFDLHDEDNRAEYVPQAHILEEYARVQDGYHKYGTVGHMYTSALKDEPTKIGKESVRVFQVNPLTMVMYTRQFCLPLLEILYAIPLETEMAQGINCTNDEWDQLAHYLLAFGEDQMIEGDFSKYDLRQSGQMLRTAGFILRQIALAMGYNTYDAGMVESIVSDISFKYMIFNGSVFAIDGCNPSGNPLTIVINGMINSLLHRIVYYNTAERLGIFDVGPFRDHVKLITMGDDSVGATNLPWFNMVNIQLGMADLNMPYTDGKKNENTQEFFTFDEVQFCKRKFRFEKRVEKYVAPIEIDSIYKSLHCYMESKTLPLEIAVQNVTAGLRELARHDESTFEVERGIIRRAMEQGQLAHYVPHLEYSYEEWWNILRADFEDSGLEPEPQDLCSGSVDATES